MKSLKPSFRVQLEDMMRSSVVFLGVIVALLILSCVTNAVRGADTLSFGGYGVIAAIFVFVFGIAAPRSYVRLGLQMGVSRSTTYLAQLIAVAAMSVILAVVGELAISAANSVSAVSGVQSFTDIYFIMYKGSAGFGAHLMNIAFNICMFLSAYYSGMFFTALFWRLNKLGTIIAVVVLIVLFNLALNFIPYAVVVNPTLNSLAAAFFKSLDKGPGALMIFFLVWAAVFGVINWFIIRRAAVKTAK